MSKHGNPKIICPTSKSGILDLKYINSGSVPCSDCDDRVPVKDGVIDLLYKTPDDPSVAQKVMEWEPIISIYDSNIYRRSVFYTILSGISFDDEYDTAVKSLDLKGDETILDVACGPAMYSRPLAKSKKKGYVVGLDLSFPMLKYASHRSKKDGIDNLTLLHGDALDLPFPDNEFDAVICFGAIHLFPDIPKSLREMNRVLKPGGHFACGVYRNWLRPKNKLGLKLTKMYNDFFYKRVGVYYFYPDELGEFLKDAGFVDPECLHAKHYWIMMSAVKPK